MDKDEQISLDTLRATANNPRIVMKENTEKLDRSLDEFGPMDGIIMNVNPAINELVGGNQRTVKFREAGAKAIITKRFDEPTDTGTLAYGYVDFNNERHPYREVFWDKLKHGKGVLLANQHVGTNDNDALAERYDELLTLDPDALDTLFITDTEIEGLQDGWVDHDELANEEPEPPKDKVTRYTIEQLYNMREKFTAEVGMPDNGFCDWLSKQ